MKQKNELPGLLRLDYPPQDEAEWRKFTFQFFMIAVAIGYVYSILADMLFGVRIKIF